MSHPPSPPDRSHLATEKRLAASSNLDELPVSAVLQLMNDQDALVAVAVRSALPRIAEVVERAVTGMERGGRLIYLGAGTSGRLGVLDASECPPTFHCDPSSVVGIIAGGDSALRKSSEGMEDDPDGARPELDRLKIGANDTVIGIAAGGTTPYVHGGLAIAKQRGAATALLCCVDASALQQGNPKQAAPQLEDSQRRALPADVIISLPTGPEVVTGSTRMKAGTATKLALNMISTAVMVRLGKVWGNLMVDLRATNAKLRDRAARLIQSQTGLDRAAALELLDRASGRVKLALVMHLKHLDAGVAQRLLDQHHGRLRPILGPPR